jgi:hypothetical protein
MLLEAGARLSRSPRVCLDDIKKKKIKNII